MMKNMIALIFLSFGLSCAAQDLPPAPCDSINLRLNLYSDYVARDAMLEDTAWWTLIIGGIFTGIEYAQAKDDKSVAYAIGGTTIGGFITLQLFSGRQRRRGAKALHQ